MWPNPQETADLVTLTEEILNKKLHFLCSELSTAGERQIKTWFRGLERNLFTIKKPARKS